MSRRSALVLVLGAFAASSAGAPAASTDGGALAEAVERIGDLAGVRSVQVWRGDELRIERTFRGADLGPHDVKSASKSVLSALVGIALERGQLPGLDATVGELLPEASAALDERKRAITLGDLLSMESGLATTSGKAYGAWVEGGDWVRGALGRPLERPPGSAFTYSTGNSHLVAAALSRACSCDLLDWGREVLFDPLGMEVVAWARDPSGIRFGGNSFRLAPAELAKLGRLYLAGGRWRGRELVPREWIERSTRRHADGWPERYGAYGLLWWLPPLANDEGAFAAIGFGGQYLVVSPAFDAVVTITSTHLGKGVPWDRRVLTLLDRELLPAIGEGRRDPAARPTGMLPSPGGAPADP